MSVVRLPANMTVRSGPTVREVWERDEWNALILTLPHHDLRQGYEWGEVRATQGWQPTRFAAFRGDVCVGAASLLTRHLPLVGGSVLYASGGPLLGDPTDQTAWPALLEATRALASRERAIFLRASPKVGHENDDLGKALVGQGFVALPDDWTTWNSPRIVMVMDLREPEEVLSGRLRKRFREYIASGPSRGVLVRPAVSVEEGWEFQEVLATVGRRKGMPVRGREYFERIWKEYVRPGGGVLLVAEHGGRAVGGLLGVRFGTKAYMLHVTLREQAERLHQGPLLYWEFIRWAKQAGCTSLDWGGVGTNFPPRQVDPGYGIYHFKLGFSSSLEYLAGYYDLVFSPQRYRAFRFLERRVFAAAWTARAALNNRFLEARDLLQTARRKLRQFRISAAQRGVATTLYWAAFGFLRPNRFVVLAKDLAADDLGVPRQDGVRFDMWEAGAVRAWRRSRQGLSPDFFQDQIDGVDTCAVALVDGELAGLIWVYRPDDASRFFRLGELEAELNNGLVQPAYRGRRLFQGIISRACLCLKEQGFQTACAMVHSNNTPSLRAFHGAGFREVGTVWQLLVYRPKVRCSELGGERPTGNAGAGA